MYKKLRTYIAELNIGNISEERRAILSPFQDYLSEKYFSGKETNLLFVCTHNSRRSILAQVWAQAMVAHFQIPNLRTESGGTAVTGVYQTALDVLVETGFKITLKGQDRENLYYLKFDSDMEGMPLFSKLCQGRFDSGESFAAIMCCETADKNCPYIPGAEKRIPLLYEDPKSSDNSPREKKTYLARSEQIATEMKYVFDGLKIRMQYH